MKRKIFLCLFCALFLITGCSLKKENADKENLYDVLISFNPKLLVRINKDQIVKEIKQLNDDSEIYVTDELLNTNIEDFTTKFIEISKENGYLENNDTEITIAFYNEENTEIKEELLKTFNTYKIVAKELTTEEKEEIKEELANYQVTTSEVSIEEETNIEEEVNIVEEKPVVEQPVVVEPTPTPPEPEIGADDEGIPVLDILAKNWCTYRGMGEDSARMYTFNRDYSGSKVNGDDFSENFTWKLNDDNSMTLCYEYYENSCVRGTIIQSITINTENDITVKIDEDNVADYRPCQ